MIDWLQVFQKDKRITFSVLAALFLLVILLVGGKLLFTVVMLLWCASVLFCLRDIKNRAAYLVFLLSFFLFLLGGEFLELYAGYEQEYSFVQSLDNHAYASLFFSLLFLLIGFYASDYLGEINRPRTLRTKKINKELRVKIRYFARIAMYICIIPYLLKALDAALYTSKHGYLSYYTTYKSRLPGIFEVLSELYTMFMFMFLATMPTKKSCVMPVCGYLIQSVLTMMTGRRISLGVALLVIMFYVLFRHGRNPQAGWINKKTMILAILACPLMILALHMLRYMRYGESVEGGSLMDMICSFLSQQGFSINILKLQKELEGDSLGCTSLYYTIHYLRGNVLTRHLFDFPMEYYTQRSVETALHTNCLADYIMYMVDAEDFFAGYGLGTSYIAELYHDLGFFGIALGSSVYGVILNRLFSAKNLNCWKLAAGMMMLEEFVIMPRYGADVILRPFYNLTKMAVLVLFITVIYVPIEDMQKFVPGKLKKGK